MLSALDRPPRRAGLDLRLDRDPSSARRASELARYHEYLRRHSRSGRSQRRGPKSWLAYRLAIRSAIGDTRLGCARHKYTSQVDPEAYPEACNV